MLKNHALLFLLKSEISEPRSSSSVFHGFELKKIVWTKHGVEKSGGCCVSESPYLLCTFLLLLFTRL